MKSRNFRWSKPKNISGDEEPMFASVLLTPGVPRWLKKVDEYADDSSGLCEVSCGYGDKTWSLYSDYVLPGWRSDGVLGFLFLKKKTMEEAQAAFEIYYERVVASIEESAKQTVAVMRRKARK